MSIARVIQEVETFKHQVRESDTESLDLTLERYVSFKRTMARLFRDFAEAKLQTGAPVIDKIYDQIRNALQAFNDGKVPEKYLVVSPFNRTHTILLEYLARYVGTPVSGSKLRVLTGDQIHTERRLRELRDLGLHITSARVANDDQYILHSLELNLKHAATTQLLRNIKDDREIASRERAQLIEAVVSTASKLR